MDWIKTSERIPEQGQNVLIYFPDNPYVNSSVWIVMFDKYLGCFCDYTKFIDLKDISHWMPLPEPPKVKNIAPDCKCNASYQSLACPAWDRKQCYWNAENDPYGE